MENTIVGPSSPRSHAVYEPASIVPPSEVWPYGLVGGHETDLARLLREPPPPIEWAIEPLIPEASLTSINGEGATGKSYVLIQMAIQMALGQPVFGRFNVRRPYNVLYLDLEMPERATDSRFYRFLSGSGVTADSLPAGLHVIPAATLLFDDMTAVGQLDAMITSLKLDFVLIDSFRRSYLGDGMRSEIINNVFKRVTYLRNKHRVGFIFIDHWRKPKAEAGMNEIKHRLTESADKRNILDVNLGVEKVKDVDDALLITPEKDRHGDGGLKPFQIRFLNDDVFDEMSPLRLKYVSASRNPVAAAILRALEAAPDCQMRTKDVVLAIHSNDKAVQRAAKELEDEKVLHRKRFGKNDWRLILGAGNSADENMLLDTQITNTPLSVQAKSGNNTVTATEKL